MRFSNGLGGPSCFDPLSMIAAPARGASSTHPIVKQQPLDREADLAAVPECAMADALRRP
jgi:hypothetical protein